MLKQRGENQGCEEVEPDVAELVWTYRGPEDMGGEQYSVHFILDETDWKILERGQSVESETLGLPGLSALKIRISRGKAPSP